MERVTVKTCRMNLSSRIANHILSMSLDADVAVVNDAAWISVVNEDHSFQTASGDDKELLFQEVLKRHEINVSNGIARLRPHSGALDADAAIPNNTSYLTPADDLYRPLQEMSLISTDVPPPSLSPSTTGSPRLEGEATWDREIVLPVEGISSTYLTAPASHVDMQPYNYSSSSPMYSAEVQHSEGPPPSEPLTDYSLPCNGFGLVGQSSDPSQPNYESLTLPNSQPSLNHDRHTTNPEQDQIIFGERPPASYVPTSMDVDPPMPVPQVAPPTFPGAADSVAPGLIPVVSSQYNFPKHTRGERKPKVLEKMRSTNKVAQFSCNLCSPVRSFTVKSARDRHMQDKHSGAPPAACSLCGNPYRDQCSLQRHQRLHHGSNATVGKSRSSKKQVTPK
ncbi:hypothetical protein BDZ89DRAFT_187126 [Hymenopellis radicata]|nr:hypothetical protein BDZ89DRAFT_187126 [Hymenopellis radicata]